MLSDDDRRALGELEARLATEDAAFVRSFDVATPRLPTPHPPTPHPPTPPPAPVAQLAGSVVLGMLMWLAGSLAGAVAFLAAAATIGLAWWYAA